ncbi:MAG TPA: T9SS type A sorting domain-containing protein, partial [Chitinophagaceae bacterium]|nr:T9SS type A sorting domain-containing protein [Chitinophagaceae bacterium]
YYVTYYMPQAGSPVTITIIDMKGRRIVERHETTSAPYTRFDFTNVKLASGVYVIEFRDPGGDRLAAGRLVVVRK